MKREERKGVLRWLHTQKREGKLERPIVVDGRLLKYIKLDYTISAFEAIVLVDASEKERGDQRR